MAQFASGRRIEQGQLGSIGRLEDGEPLIEVGATDRFAVPGWLPSSGPGCAARVRRQARRGDAVRRRHQGHEPRIASRHVRSAPRARNRERRSGRGAGSVGRGARVPVRSSPRSVASQGLAPRAQSHSSFVRRTALRSAASCLASVVFPAPGNPQVRISRASRTVCQSSSSASCREQNCRCCVYQSWAASSSAASGSSVAMSSSSSPGSRLS